MDTDREELKVGEGEDRYFRLWDAPQNIAATFSHWVKEGEIMRVDPDDFFTLNICPVGEVPHGLQAGDALSLELCLLFYKGDFFQDEEEYYAEEERAIWTWLHHFAARGNWEALHTLLQLALARPGSTRLSQVSDALLLARDYSEKGNLQARDYLYWATYFGYFEKANPGIAREARKLLEEGSSASASLLCLCGFDRCVDGGKGEGLQMLELCQEKESVALGLLALFADSEREFGTVTLQEPVWKSLEAFLSLSSEYPELLVRPWLKAMERYTPPTGGQSHFIEALLYLHGLAEYPEDVDMALDSLARAASQHFLPALGMLADITGRGLYGCDEGPLFDTDWLEEGCRHLEPRSLAVHGLLNGHGDLKQKLASERLADYTLEDLLQWCGSQNTDALCQALHAVYLLDGFARKDPEVVEDSYAWAEMAGRRLSEAILLAQAMADAGALLYLGGELARLADEDKKEKNQGSEEDTPLRTTAYICLDYLKMANRLGCRTNMQADTPEPLDLLALFCLDRALFFGEPKAKRLLETLALQMDMKGVMESIDAMNLKAPLKDFVCPVNFVHV